MVLRDRETEKYDSLLQKILDFISEILAVEWDYGTLVHNYSGDLTSIKGKGPDGENVRFLTLKDYYLQEHMGWIVSVGRTKIEPPFFMQIRNKATDEDLWGYDPFAQSIEKEWK